MRIQMRLSKEARVVLEELKLEYLKKGEDKTSGVIVDEILADYTSVNPTTLNLSDSTITTMSHIRNHFNSILDMKRTVYRSFIIRMVLKAYKLKNEGINIDL